MQNSAPIARVILYVKNIPKVAAFYQRIFGMTRIEGKSDGWQVLVSPDGGCPIVLFKASVAQKSGAAMKLVFSVADVQGFKRDAEKKGVKFGPVHHTEHNGQPYQFANAKDPNGNSISISSRGVSRTKEAPSAYELAEGADIIGAARKLSKDLSINPHHLDRLGQK